MKLYLNRIKWITIIVGLLGIGIWFGIHFKEGIQYILQDNSKGGGPKSLYDVRTVEVLSRHQEMMVGFDVSHYQGVIDWQSIDSIASLKPLEFVFIRATMGADGVDKAFKLNWKGARSNHFIRGAYHYYRPDENSLQQANNFIKNVKLSEGDLPPVLDIEDLPKEQSMDSLRSGLQRWIATVEKHYKVKPILYSGEHYYTKNLKKWFPDHILWIANYNFFVEEIKPDWHFWQFSEKGIIPGIDTKVDLNIYQGNKTQMRTMLIK
ncbi:glycoside hydrolase family 25 protein [Myroides sp. LJL115]